MIRTYQYQGFLDSNIDPLNLKPTEQSGNKFKEQLEKVYLDFRNSGFTEQDLDKEYLIYDPNIGGIRSEQKSFKLKEIIDTLNRAYCGTIGVEFMHLIDSQELNWFRDKFENVWANYKVDRKGLLHNFNNVAKAVLFEEFLKNKFTTAKRFGLEGLETVITGLEAYVDKSVELGVRDVTLGMPHRGRLNVLANVFKKPVSKIIGEFQGKITNEALKEVFYAGDVKYHLGTYNEREYEDGSRVFMDIMPNPSHLECVSPVANGKTRAKQTFNNDIKREKHISIHLHGDASFAGQGIVYETLQMSRLENYQVGGSLHVVANNQVGFTTTPKDARSTLFSSDIGKAFDIPIIHVNADDPVAVEFCFKIAAEYRNKFNKDIIIDVIGYR